MSRPFQAAFQRLNSALGQLEGAVAQYAKRSETLADRVTSRGQEGRLTHEALLAGAWALLAQSQLQDQQIRAAGEQAGQSLEAYGREIDRFTDVVTVRIEGPLGEMEALGMMMLNSLHAQRNGLDDLNDEECAADEDRAAGLAGYISALQQNEAQLGAFAEALTQTAGASAAAMRTDMDLEAHESRKQGLALNQQAVIAFRQGLRQAPSVLLEEAVRLAPNDGIIWLNLASACLEARRIDRAAEALQRAAEIAPGSPDIAYTEGLLALSRGDADLAIPLLERCLSGAGTQADEVTYRAVLAQAYWAAGRPLPALEQWRRMLALEPAHPIAEAWLAATE